MHYDRWRGQWVGQATDGASTSTTIPADAAAGASDITSANYQQALNTQASQIASLSNATGSSISPTTYVIGGVVALGLIYFFTRK